MKDNYTEEEMKKASKLSDEEVDWINNKTKDLLDAEPRYLMLFGLIGNIVGNVIHQSDGELDKETCMKFIDMSIEE